MVINGSEPYFSLLSIVQTYGDNVTLSDNITFSYKVTNNNLMTLGYLVTSSRTYKDFGLIFQS